MVAKVLSVAAMGFDGRIIEVESDAGNPPHYRSLGSIIKSSRKPKNGCEAPSRIRYSTSRLRRQRYFYQSRRTMKDTQHLTAVGIINISMNRQFVRYNSSLKHNASLTS